jgi:hypothetical protein
LFVSCHPTFCVLLPRLQISLETASVLVVELEAPALAAGAAHPSLGVLVLPAGPVASSRAARLSPAVAAVFAGPVAVPEIADLSPAAVLAAELEAPALAAGAAHPSLGPVVLAAALEASSRAARLSPGAAAMPAGPETVPESADLSPAVSSLPAGPQVSVRIAVVSVVSMPVSVVVVEVDNLGRPRFLAAPNVDHCASPASSVEVVGMESADSPIDAHTNYGL